MLAGAVLGEEVVEELRGRELILNLEERVKMPFESFFAASRAGGVVEDRASVFNTNWLGPMLRSSQERKRSSTAAFLALKRQNYKPEKRRGSTQGEPLGLGLDEVVNREK